MYIKYSQWTCKVNVLLEIMGVRAPSHFGLGDGGDLLARKKKLHDARLGECRNRDTITQANCHKTKTFTRCYFETSQNP